MTHGSGRWRGNMRVSWVASSLALYLRTWCIQHYHHYYRWRALLGCRSTELTNPPPPRQFKWTRPFRWKTKSGFCACAITFQMCSTTLFYRGDKSLFRPGRKQPNVSARMAWISFGALPCKGGGDFMTARVSMLLKSRASLTCFRACFLPGQAKDLSAHR